LEQLEMLGTLVVPVLRREFAALKPAHVPEAPTHASLLAAREAAANATDVAPTMVTAAPSGEATALAPEPEAVEAR
ncbi:MAG TPA: hypothetical protein VGM28_03150, partial [Candidatus Limnocylindrales bacterium]